MPALPGHMVVGRGSFSGPVIGNYVTIPFGPKSLAAGGTGTDVPFFGFIAPCDMRIERISWNCRTASLANVSLQFYKDPTDFDASSGATALLTAAIDLDASSGANGSSYAEAAAGGATTLVAAARNISKGDRVFAGYTYDVNGTLTDAAVMFTCFITGHINADPAND